MSLEVTDYDSSWVGKQLSSPVYYKLIIKKKKKKNSELTLNKFYLYSTDKQQSRHLLAIEKYVLSPVLKIDSLENEKIFANKMRQNALYFIQKKI